MGIFADWQPRYAERGIATFPVEITSKGQKKPLVSNYLRMGRRASDQLPRRFGGADMLGFVVGPKSRITILDVDTDDARVLADALDRHGPTPLIAKSVSGHFHCYYRHNGEGRRIRPNPKLPIDILGSGFTVAPPSKSINGRYQFIDGGLGHEFVNARRHPQAEGVCERRLFRRDAGHQQHAGNDAVGSPGD